MGPATARFYGQATASNGVIAFLFTANMSFGVIQEFGTEWVLNMHLRYEIATLSRFPK